ncbi:MAG: hypothetical protein Q7T40_08195 [Methylobacter sp.]|nr:hypothetical protein [Methylobacter sp.]
MNLSEHIAINRQLAECVCQRLTEEINELGFSSFPRAAWEREKWSPNQVLDSISLYAFRQLLTKSICVVELDINNHDDQTEKTPPSICFKRKIKQHLNMA